MKTDIPIGHVSPYERIEIGPDKPVRRLGGVTVRTIADVLEEERIWNLLVQAAQGSGGRL